MANAATHDVLQRLLQRVMRDELQNLSPSERAAFEQQFEGFFGQALESSSSPTSANFPDFIGLGPNGVEGGCDEARRGQRDCGQFNGWFHVVSPVWSSGACDRLSVHGRPFSCRG